MLIGGGRSSRYPFTASQWQELEHQALIFKYMMSGLPVPPELIIPIRRSLFMDSTTLPFFPPPPPPLLGWGAHQMGYGRKAEDPEPGRCRRTDGKKWRCSKEAYPDSKYCERHMHRGKSRSRKLVELSLATNSTSAHEFPAVKDLLPLPPPPPPPPLSLSFPCSSSSRFPPATGFSHPDSTANFSLLSLPHAVDTYRNFLGFKEDINELPFFSESTGAARGTCCSQPTGRFDYKQEGGGSHFRSDSLEKKDRHCFVLGSDLRSEREEGEERQKLGPFHCFFDELPQRSRAPWTSPDENRVQHESFSKTQLSISIPAASHELPVKASQCYSGPNLAA